MNLPEANHYVIITDDNVRELYGDALLEKLRAEGKRVDLISIPPGEKSKSRETKAMIEDALFELGADRKTLILALGGGVVGDLAGYVASNYMRGIDYVQIPTTLLAMVDSSIGGKTGIDTAHGKNVLGAIWQPKKIILDVNYLSTLDDEQFVSGLIEAVKIFLTHDAEAFTQLESGLDDVLSRDRAALEQLVARAAQLKSEVVARDEREAGERALLNFGHTVGHALELLNDYELLHGLAVAQGMLLELKVAELDGHCSAEDYERISQFLSRLPVDMQPLLEADIEALHDHMKHDKKNQNGEVHYVILSAPGEVYRGEEAGDASQAAFTHKLEKARLNEALAAIKDQFNN